MSTQNQNSFNITGNLTNDPTYRTYGENGKELLFSVANNRGYGDFAKVYFFDCKLFGKTAENMQSMLRKGISVALSGEMTIETWDQDGQTRKKFILVANFVQILTPKNSSGSSGNQGGYNQDRRDGSGNRNQGGNQGYRDNPRQDYGGQGRQNYGGQSQGNAGFNNQYRDEDIPF